MNRRSWVSAATASLAALLGLKGHTPAQENCVDYDSLCNYIAWDICKGKRSDSIPKISGYLKILVNEFSKTHTQEECRQYLWEYHHFLNGDWPTPIPPELAPHVVLKKIPAIKERWYD